MVWLVSKNLLIFKCLVGFVFWYFMNSSSSLDQASHIIPQLIKKGRDFGAAWEILFDLEAQH